MATKAEALSSSALGEGCLGRASPDEPIFVLRAQDRTAPALIRIWITLQYLEASRAEAKIDEAEEIAIAMEAWAMRTGRSKLAD